MQYRAATAVTELYLPDEKAPVFSATERSTDSREDLANVDLRVQPNTRNNTIRVATKWNTSLDAFMPVNIPVQKIIGLYIRLWALAGPLLDLHDPTCSDESFRRSLKTFLFTKY